MGDRREKFWKGILAGTAGGFAGTVAMSQFQQVWSKASEALQSNGNKSEQQSGSQSRDESEDATMKAAGKIASAAGRELSRDEKKNAGSALTMHSARAWGRCMEREWNSRRARCDANPNWLAWDSECCSLPEQTKSRFLHYNFQKNLKRNRCPLIYAAWLRTLCMGWQPGRYIGR